VSIDKVLLDTTYLLPVFEIETNKFSKRDLELLLDSGIELFFNPISLIEIKWVLIRLTKRDKRKLGLLRKVYNESVDYLLCCEEIKPTILLNGEICRLEDILYDAGIKDYFDRIIMATAKVFTGRLLTEDDDLADVVKNLKEFEDLEVLNWRQLVKTLKR